MNEGNSWLLKSFIMRLKKLKLPQISSGVRLTKLVMLGV